MPSGVYPRTAEHRRIISESSKGRIPSAETRARMSAAQKAAWARRPERRAEQSEITTQYNREYWTEEKRAEWSEWQKGKKNLRRGDPALGFSYTPQGYRVLSGQQEHPLSDGAGHLLEQRKVLYDEIGPGPHECYWQCGRVLEWGGRDGIIADHLDGDRLNNNPSNLVPSCLICNRHRGQAGNPIGWVGKRL